MIEKEFNGDFVEATQAELTFIRHNMPKGMVKMVQIRTGKSRSQVLYQIVQMPENQDADIIQAFREILYAITRLKYSPN